MGTQNLKRQEDLLHTEMKALKWAMESMPQHSTCQNFRTDYKDMITITTNLTKFLNRVKGDSNTLDMFFELQNFLHSKNAK